MVFSESLDTPASTQAFAIDLHVGGVFHTAVDEFLETLISWSIQLVGLDECVKAKEEFFRLTGKVFYDDVQYHSRMHYFLEYFLFERTLGQNSSDLFASTPFETFISSQDQMLISGFTHSLFKVAKVQSQGMVLKDLFSDSKIRIQKQEEELFKGISKGDVFQGFVFHLSDRSVLSRGLIFHPEKAHPFLLKNIKEEKKTGKWHPTQLLARMARQQLKHTRLKHVDPKLVYTDPHS